MPAVAARSPDDFRMSLSEHLGELRRRLLRVVISVVVLGIGALVFAKTLYGLLMRPVLLSLPPEASALVYTSAIEEINVYMKVGLYGGVFLTTPVILYQLWGFVSPGLYEGERKLAAPFIFFGTVAFLAGAAFCYFVILPSMFQFLLREETAVALEGRLNTGRLREEDAIRYLRLGNIARAAALAREATQDLEAGGEGQAKAKNEWGISLVPKQSVDVITRLEGLGRLIDATRSGFGDTTLPTLSAVMEKRQDAVAAYGKRDFSAALALSDEAAKMLEGVDVSAGTDMASLWQLERDLGTGKAAYESNNWTRPMLSMSEQLTLVLILLLAFGLIFEMPLVMAVLSLVGLVKASWLFKYQRHAFVVCLIAAAIITPTGDAVNLSLMAGPMLACYELGVLLVWIIEKRRKETAPAEGTGAQG
jgi:sec-independent protein translocase protein TatC